MPTQDPLLVVVTGGSGGIGLALARRFAKDGHRLLLVARSQGRLEAAAAALRADGAPSVETEACDLSDPVQTEALCARLSDRAPNILVNNAGFGAYGPFADRPPDESAGMIATNVTALTRLTAAVLPAMRARGSGRILNVASTAAFAPVPLAAVYGASKAYVLSFSEALAVELVRTGITVTALCPGPTPTGFAERAGMSQSALFQGRLTRVETVAESGYAALMAGRRHAVPGLANRLMLFAVRFVPRAFAARIARRAMKRRLS